MEQKRLHRHRLRRPDVARVGAVGGAAAAAGAGLGGLPPEGVVRGAVRDTAVREQLGHPVPEAAAGVTLAAVLSMYVIPY